MKLTSRIFFIFCILCFFVSKTHAIEPENFPCESVLNVHGIRDALFTIRGLELPDFIPCDRIDSTLLSELMMLDFKNDNPEEKLKTLAEIYYKFTLEETNYKYSDIKLFFIFVEGFYNPLTRDVYIVEDEPFARMLKEHITSGDKELNFRDLQKYIDQGPDYQQEEFVMIHEFTHAVQDLHFDLEGLMEYAKGNSDMELTFKSIVEGEASWIATEYEAHVKKIGQSAYRNIEDVLEEMKDKRKREDDYDTKEGSGFSDVLGSVVIFPYVYGQSFMQKIRREYGYGFYDKIFMDPPLSSEQIIHPEKYLDERDNPTEIILSGVEDYLNEIEDVKVAHIDTLGEFGIVSMIDAILPFAKANTAAVGWDGDRYIGFYDDDEEIQLIWFSVWDTEGEAEEFLKIYKKYSIDKNIRVEYEGSAGENGSLFSLGWGNTLYIERRGNEVAIIDCFTLDEDIEKLIDILWNSERFELESWLRPTPQLPWERDVRLEKKDVKNLFSRADELEKKKHYGAAADIMNVIYDLGELTGDSAVEGAIIYAKIGDYETALDTIYIVIDGDDSEIQEKTILEARSAEIIFLCALGDLDAAFDSIVSLYEDTENTKAMLDVMFKNPLSAVTVNKEDMGYLMYDFSNYSDSQK